MSSSRRLLLPALALTAAIGLAAAAFLGGDEPALVDAADPAVATPADTPPAGDSTPATEAAAVKNASAKAKALTDAEAAAAKAKADATAAAKAIVDTKKVADAAAQSAGSLERAQADRKAPTYIRYTPSNQGNNHAGGASSRVIRMVEAPLDPMEPPKFKHKRVPRGPPGRLQLDVHLNGERALKFQLHSRNSEHLAGNRRDAEITDSNRL